jgi:hypothetical protein
VTERGGQDEAVDEARPSGRGVAGASATDLELRTLFPHLDPEVVRRVLGFVPLRYRTAAAVRSDGNGHDSCRDHPLVGRRRLPRGG